MKKYIILVILMLSFCFFIGCGTNLNDKVVKNLSEIRYNAFQYVSSGFKISFMSGEREDPYEYDGISNKKVDFGIITAVFKDFKGFNKIPFKIELNGDVKEGLLEKNPFNSSYMADIGIKVKDDYKIKVSLNNGDFVELVNISNSWAINYEKALEIGINYTKDEILKLKNNEAAEFYLKIITDEEYLIDEFFWSFSFTDSNFKSTTVIIDVNSGEILVKTKS